MKFAFVLRCGDYVRVGTYGERFCITQIGEGHDPIIYGGRHGSYFASELTLLCPLHEPRRATAITREELMDRR